MLKPHFSNIKFFKVKISLKQPYCPDNKTNTATPLRNYTTIRLIKILSYPWILKKFIAIVPIQYHSEFK